MKALLPFQAMNQYAEHVPAAYRASACGPVTTASILLYHEGVAPGIGPLYKLLGATPIGLSAFCLIRRLRKLAGPRYDIKRIHSIEHIKQQLDAGYPLAVKFDRYFSLRWRQKTTFAYHWVPLIGYKETGDDLLLYIHDNGQKNRPSKLRAVSFRENQGVLSFIQIAPVSKSDK
ncbi:C39 family peptidase [Planococcus alpniumensis]|uniref:C39 family peptidase n=1 Tax=Planococcus alpniumensis TaxID=2708345 RepID=UPI001B8AE0C5|nr:C39 family peptidase [Planococcus sp. MSAK28401]